MSTDSLPPDGRMLGPFRLVRELGRGDACVVYEAEDTRVCRRALLKVVRRTHEARPPDPLIREARTLAGLNHPNVLGLLEIGETHGVYFLLYDFAGGTLADRLASGERLPWREAARLCAEAATGLAAFHAAGLVHRDVRPSNLLLGESGIMLADLGLAGLPHYLSPEQCRGEPADDRSDVYALGATLFHLLCGRPPFEAATGQALMYAHCARNVPDPAGLVADLPAACAAVVRRATAREPADRYPDMKAMCRDLAALAGPAASVPAATKPPAWRTYLPAVCVALAVLAVVAYLLFIRGRAEGG